MADHAPLGVTAVVDEVFTIQSDEEEVPTAPVADAAVSEEEDLYGDDFTASLGVFEGPIGLLLKFIRENKIAIEDVFVADVGEQFLAYVKATPNLDLEKMAACLAIAATILKIKSQSLIPVSYDDEDDMFDEELEEERRRITDELYKRQMILIKGEMDKLKELEQVGYFFKEPDASVGERRVRYNLDGMTRDSLMEAFARVMMNQSAKQREHESREIPRDSFTVEQKVGVILESLEEQKEVRFDDLFSNDRTRPEVVTTFQAMLELLKLQYLCVKQTEIFGEIIISLNPDRKEGVPFGTIDEYN